MKAYVHNISNWNFFCFSANMNSSSSLKAFRVNIAKTELTLPLMNGLLLGAMHWLGCNSSSMTSKSYLLYHFDYLCAAPSYNNLEAARLPSPPILTFVGHDEKKNLSMIPFWTNFMREKKEFIIKKRRADYSQMGSKQKDDIPRLLSNFWLPTLIHLRKEYFHVDLE